MPGLKFRILLDSEKQEEIFRDILIADTADFEIFYTAILKAFELKGDQMASFYVSNDEWDKGHELSLMDMTYDDDSIDTPAAVMKQAIIKDFITEPDQKFILVYDFLSMWIFLIELIGYDKQIPEVPTVLLSIGKAPSEDERKVMDDTLFEETAMEELEDEDELGLDEFDDGYGDDDLNDYNEYEY